MTNIAKSTLQKIISDSDILAGFRVLIAMLFAFIPFILSMHIPFFIQSTFQNSISLCLGIIVSALVEVDDNTKGRLKVTPMIIGCFFIASASVELLMPYPFLFAIGLFSSTFIFMMLAIYGNHYTKIGFGTVLIAINTMIGYSNQTGWYENPIMLSLGALWYVIFAVFWNIYNPYTSLKEQIAQLYFAISRYQNQKAALFNASEGRTKTGRLNIRQQLAIRNIPIVERMANAKLSIELHHNATKKKKKKLQQLNQYWLIAEQIHEMTTASQFIFSHLESIFESSQILEGYYQLITQMSNDCYQLGLSISNHTAYQHSRQLKWTICALADQLILLDKRLSNNKENNEARLGLKAIYDNLNNINTLLLLASTTRTSELPAISIKKTNALTNSGFVPAIKSAWHTLKQAFTASNPSLKHAVRISVSLLIAFILQKSLHLAHGFWLLLTVLVVCQPSFSETRKRITQRTIGTLTGILIAYPLLLVVDNVMVDVILLVSCAFLFFCYLRTNYALSVIFITLLVTLIFNILTPQGFEMLPYRIIETLLGSLLSFLAITFIMPEWESSHSPKLVQKVLQQSKHYLTQIIDQYRLGVNNSYKFTHVRFKIFQANAVLTTAWQHTLLEPKYKQTLNKETYTLVNRTDALVSYISALSSHRHFIKKFDDNLPLKKLLKLTVQQIELPLQVQKDPTMPTNALVHDDFDECKVDQTADILLIIEQLRLIAFTAFDIHVLLQALNSQTTAKIKHHDI
ncbi:MAG: FUSC family protein [Psychromonas sp.]|nr:FUSC family protein [Psychromonas sp.]